MQIGSVLVLGAILSRFVGWFRPPQPVKELGLFGAAKVRRLELAEEFVSRYGRVVLAGPFKGLTLPEGGSWGIADILPKLLGQYELELHESIEYIKNNVSIDAVVDVGCADGYYAVGFSLIFQEARVFAYDTDASAQYFCRKSATENNVLNRLKISGFCGADRLQAVLELTREPLVFCDCEGFELDLLDPKSVPMLSKAWIIVECHNFINRESSKILANRFLQSHSVSEIAAFGRNPNLHEWQRVLPDLDRWLTICEFRPETMCWLICKPNNV